MNPITLSAASMTFSERMSYGLQVFAVGLGTVFAVLTALWLALILFKVFLYDMPMKKEKKKAEEALKNTPAVVAEPVAEPVVEEAAEEAAEEAVEAVEAPAEEAAE